MIGVWRLTTGASQRVSIKGSRLGYKGGRRHRPLRRVGLRALDGPRAQANPVRGPGRQAHEHDSRDASPRPAPQALRAGVRSIPVWSPEGKKVTIGTRLIDGPSDGGARQQPRPIGPHASKTRFDRMGPVGVEE